MNRFQQYPFGPWLPASLLAVNLKNHAERLDNYRRDALRSLRWTNRSDREWAARQYLNAKRDLQFIKNQIK